jgi:hypothetical protein
MGKCPEGIAASSSYCQVNRVGSSQAHHVGIGTEEDRGGAKSTVGGSPEEIAANSCGSEVHDLVSSKTRDFRSGQEKDGCGYPCTLGGVPSGEEESGLATWGTCFGTAHAGKVLALGAR